MTLTSQDERANRKKTAPTEKKKTTKGDSKRTAKKSTPKTIPIDVPEDDSVLDDEVWAAANAFFEENGLAAEQIQSYNDWATNQIHKIFELAGKFSVASAESEEKIRVVLSNLRFQEPKITETDDSVTVLYPQAALSRNITYCSAISVDITVTTPGRPVKNEDGTITPGKPTIAHHESQPLGFVPVMVGSVLCNTHKFRHDPVEMAAHNEPLYDEGGYFIIAPKAENSSGGTANRRVLVPQERAAPNSAVILKNRKTNPKYPLYCEIRSTENVIHATVTTVGYLNGKLGFVLPWIDGVEIPIAVLFRALGVDTETEIVQLILGPDFAQDREALELLVPSLEYAYECTSQEQALYFIGSRGRKTVSTAGSEGGASDDVDQEDFGDVADGADDFELVRELLDASERANKKMKDRTREEAISYAKSLLSNEFLPHIGRGEAVGREDVSGGYFEKARFAGYMAKKEIEAVLGRRPTHDRDHYGGKRLITTQVLFNQQIYSALRRINIDISQSAKTNLRNHTPFNIRSSIKPAILTNALQGGISANTWSASSNAKGISQILEQYNHIGGLANKRKRNIQMAEGGNVIGPRDLHPSQEFTQCPAETPEGKNCGLVKNAALAAYTTLGTDAAPVIDLVRKIVGSSYLKHFPEYLKWVAVLVNGRPIGYTLNGTAVAAKLRKYRRSAQFSLEVSIFHDEKNREILIFTDQGRFARPLFVVENGELVYRTGHVKRLNSGDLTWTQLMAEGCVEIVDKLEEEGAYVVNSPSELEALPEETRKKVTHCELHPSLVYGVGGSLIPWPDHNPSPRNTYQCIHHLEKVSMADGSKKAIGEIKLGDEILTVDPTTLAISKTKVVAHLLAPTEKKMYEIVAAEFPLHPRDPKVYRIRATFDHLFLVSREGKKEWMPAEKLSALGSEGRVILKSSPDYGLFCPVIFCNIIRVTEIVRDDSKGTHLIADLTTESENHSFIANGFVVHNSAMGKQAMGVPFTNHNQMMTGTHHVLQHPQKPLCMSRAACILNYDKLPAGQMATILVAPRPKGEEDSLIFNKSSVDMGFMVSYQYTNLFSECRDAGEFFGKPTEEECEKWKGNARWLTEEGFAKKGARLEIGDIVMAKLVPIRNTDAPSENYGDGTGGRKKYSVSTVVYGEQLAGIVHRIEVGFTGDGFRFTRMQICQRRPPVIGDKFAARHGQKGTMGDMLPPEDMPFSESGVNPDMIINCLAFPSRMTIAMLVECLAGLVVCEGSVLHELEWPSPGELGFGEGSETNSPFDDMFSHPSHPEIVDATPFRKFDINVIRTEMRKYGFDCGDEIIYDGTTGQRYRSMAFFGVCHISRLRHLVMLKKHSRSRGPRNSLSRQPKEGKRDNGGLRIGVMERDVLVATGLSGMLRDRMMEQSDETKVWFCRICGMQAHVDRLGTVKECRICCTNQVAKVRMPYGSKLVNQELHTMGVVCRTLTDEFEVPR